MITIALLAIVISLIGYIIKYAWTCNQHWKKKGVKHLKPVLFFGNCLPLIRNKKNISQIIEELFNTFPDESVVGFYEFLTPRLFLRDPDIINSVLIKDFSSFTDHGVDVDFDKSPREEQLFVMNGKRWRVFRAKLAPIFTSGKLKEMLTIMTTSGENLLEYFQAREKEDIDVREVMGLFSVDIIGSAVFGMDPGTLKNPDNQFRKMGKQLTAINFTNIMRIWLMFACPKIMRYFGYTFVDQKVANYFGDILEKTIDYRKEKGIYRNDFIQMMIQLKEKGNVEIQNWDANDDYLKTDESATPAQEKIEFTNDIVIAQAQGFMINGFEGTGILMSYTLVELSQHDELQEKLREEIREQIKLNGGLNYESLRGMKLLEASIKETQRMYALVTYLLRVCTKTHEFPNGYVIQKGESVAVPVAAVHMDPNNYENPTVYDPTRFLEPVKPGTYLAFGDGPRMCIAMRYTMLVMKYGLALLLTNYKIKLAPNVTYPLKINLRSFGAFPLEELMIQVEKI